MESVTVTVINWLKHNPRKDLKRPTWFALSNDLLDDEKLADFSPLEFHAFIYIMCQASRKCSATVDLFFAHSEKRGIAKDLLLKVIKKLESKSMVAVDVQNPNVHVQIPTVDVRKSTATLHNTTDITLHNTTPLARFDFEIAYKAYPRKIGKDLGIKRLKSKIKTQDEYDSFLKSVQKYASHCRKERTDPKFIKHFSTFVGTDEVEPWREFVSIDPPVNANIMTLPQVPEVQRAPLTEAEKELNKKRFRELQQALNKNIKTPAGA